MRKLRTREELVAEEDGQNPTWSTGDVATYTGQRADIVRGLLRAGVFTDFYAGSDLMSHPRFVPADVKAAWEAYRAERRAG